MSDAALELLGQSWSEVQDGALERLAATEARVVRWVWASVGVGWEELAPLAYECRGERPKGRVLAKAPADMADGVLYGFDDRDELLLARRYRSGGAEDVLDDVIRMPAEGDSVVQLCFYRPFGGSTVIELQKIERATLRNGAVVAVDVWSGPPELGAHAREAFSYAGRRVERIDYSFTTHERPDPLRYAFDASYDDTGKLQVILKRQAGADDRVVYRALPAGAVRQARRRAVSALADAVIVWANAQRPTCEVRAIAIAYDGESGEPLPPALGIITSSDASHVSGAEPEDLWNPAEFPGFDASPRAFENDLRLVEDCSTLNTAWGATLDTDASRKLLVDVAKAVATRRDEITVPAPREIAVYAVDLELADLKRNLRASVARDVVDDITSLVRSSAR